MQWLSLAGPTAIFAVLTFPLVGDARAEVAQSGAQSPVGRWRMTGSMNERREYGGGVRLNDGRVLAVSGHPLGGKSIASAEVFDPQTGKWTPTGSLRQARNGGNNAILLPDGCVLLAGGHSNSAVIKGAEIFEPASGTWSDAGELSVARDPVATLLADGRVLLAAGIDWFIGPGKPYDVADIYDPVWRKWTVTGPMTGSRYEFRSVLLNDGRVLAVGGYGPSETLLASAELFDPAAGRWRPAESLPDPRGWFGLVRLIDGRAMVVGGYTGSRAKRTYLASTLVYDPASGHWSEGKPMNHKRAGFSITLLAGGCVLVAGGVAEGGLELNSAEVWDASTGLWHLAAPMHVARRNHRAALLSDASVLVIGGSSTFGGKFLDSCEIYQP